MVVRNRHGYSINSRSHRIYQPEADVALVRKAYEFSAKAHEGQTSSLRRTLPETSGRRGRSPDLLKNGCRRRRRRHSFMTRWRTRWPRPTFLKGSLEKKSCIWSTASPKSEKSRFRAHEEKQAENFRKMVLSMADDIRVVIIKIADRLHNMRTLEHLGEASGRRSLRRR